MSDTAVPLTEHFIFATGIECSYPTIADRNGNNMRVDELARCFHYQHWREDLELVRQEGIQYLRYGPPYYSIHRSADSFDWAFPDLVLPEMRRLGITPILDLCHFGVPDWIGDFQNPDWPSLFKFYAREFCRRYPWIRFYTPVNEIYVCAKLSTIAGMWNERRKNDERAFVTALDHLCRANLLAIEAILEVRPDAVFVQSESAEYFHIGSPNSACIEKTLFENHRRFLPFDLLFSMPPSGDLVQYLYDNGFSQTSYKFFMSHRLSERIIMGNDFYERNEQIVMPDGTAKPAGDVLGWGVITREYFERYHRPVMHTETNYMDAELAPRWLWKEFFNVQHLRSQGVPVIGFTWYSLTDQVDWDSGLLHDRGVVNPVGLFDLQRKPRPVLAAFRALMHEFKDLPLVGGSSVFKL